MLCKSPFMIGPLPVGCARCMPCRVAKKRNWTFRLELEHKKFPDSCVATLTYKKSKLPEGGRLVPEHTQAWLKSLRKILAPQKIRYFLVGEYGEGSRRPHYHVILFNLNAAVAGGIDHWSGLVARTWKHGNVFVDRLKPEGIAYVAGYVTKKLCKEELDERGLPQEFTRMSLRPGIGASAVKDIARVLRSDVGLQYVNDLGDVPYALRYGSKTVSIGRYLRRKLRGAMGFASEDAPFKKKAEYWAEMFALRKKAQADPSRKAQSFPQYLIDMNAQKVRNLEARFAIQPIRRKL